MGAAGDRDKYSLKTGDTTMMPAVKVPEPSGTVSEGELVGEMKKGRSVVLIFLVLGLAAVATIVWLFAH